MAFLWGAAGEKLTPKQASEQRKIAQALLSQASDTSPVGHWTASLNRGLQGYLGGRQSYLAREGEKLGDQHASSIYKSLPGMGGGSVASALAGGGAPVAGGSVGGGGGVNPVNIGGSQEEFINALMPYALQVQEQYGIAPEITLAQAALETGWGKSAPGNNFFGIKSHGKSGGNTLATTEVINGQPVRVNDSFRAYESPGESVLDYGRFLSENPRYKPMLAASGDLEAQIDALGKSGYATDPNYASKIRSIAYGIRPRIGDTSAVAAAPVAGGNSAAILAAMADPHVSERYGPQLQAMLGQTQARENAVFQQQLQAQDPLRQLQIQQAQLEIEKMRRGQPDEYAQRAAAASQFGLQEGTPTFQQFVLTGNIPQGNQQGDYASRAAAAREFGLQEGTPAFQQFVLTGNIPSGSGSVNEYDDRMRVADHMGLQGDQRLRFITEGKLPEGVDPVAAEAAQVALEQAKVNLSQSQQPKPGYQTLTPQQASVFGLDPNKTWQQSPEGQFVAVDERDPLAARRSELEVQRLEQDVASGATPKLQFMPMANGDLIALSPDGTFKNVGSFASPEEATSAQKNYQFLIDEGVRQEEALTRAFSGGVTVNTGGGNKLDEELGKRTGEEWAKISSAGNQAAASMADIEILEELLTMAPQGPVSGRLAGAFPGVNSAASALESVVKRLAPSMRAEGSGSTSDIEYAGMLASLPALHNNYEANVAIVGMMRAKAELDMERAKVIDAYQNQDISDREARSELSRLNSRSIMTPQLKAILSGVSPQGSGVSPTAPMSSGGVLRYNPETGALEPMK